MTTAPRLEIPARFRERLYLSLTEVAELVPTSRRKLEEMAKAGDFEGATKLAGQWAIPAPTVWGWLGVGSDRVDPEVERILQGLGVHA